MIFSRQIGTLGVNTMKKVSSLTVIVIGCETISFECCKSLVLMGISKIYLHDKTIYNYKYKGRILNQFNEPGQKLCNMLKAFLLRLNPSIRIEIINGNLDKNVNTIIKNNKIDAIINTVCEELNNIETICLNHKIPYLFGHNSEFIGYVFVNFGNWTTNDYNGENTLSSFIDKFEINSNDIILYLNGIKNLPISNNFIISNNNISLDITSINTEIIKDYTLNTSILKLRFEYKKNLENFITKNNNVLIKEKKKVLSFNHVCHSEIKKNHSYQLIKLNTSFKKDDIFYDNYMNFLQKNSNANFKKAHGFIDKDIKFYPIGVIIANIIAQEVIKVTQKYTPLNQELLIDYSGLYSSNNYLSTNRKLNDVWCLLDRDLIKKMKNSKIFLVGCGALGCEISKNLAMIGFCHGKKGLLTITDMDTINISNICRQFVYQKGDVGKMKSDVLKKQLNLYSKDTNIYNLTKQLNEENENVFTTEFWKDKHIVINALDNIEARTYVDNKCTIFDKPLFESGTLGTKANTQSIIPYSTATYSEIKDPQTDEIPVCTIKDFPNNQEHCIQWALDLFDTIFTKNINDLRILIESKDNYIEILQKTNDPHLQNVRLKNLIMFLEAILSILTNNKLNFYNYINYVYIEYFYNPIKNILQTYPEDYVEENGKLFWTGSRLLPKLYNSDILTKDVIESFLNIFNLIIKTNINLKIDNLIFKETATNITIESLFNILNKISDTGINIKNIEKIDYDKDINQHCNMLLKLVNLRCKIYNIKESNYLEVQLKSGNIIPTIATTTSIISAFIIIDILKYLSNHKFKYTESNINLATNEYHIYDALSSKVIYNNMFDNEYGINIKTIPRDFNSWSKIKISLKDDKINTVFELITILKYQFNIKPNILSIKNKIIYNKSNKIDISFRSLYKQLNKSYSDILKIDNIMFDEQNIPVITPPIIYSYL